MTHTTCGWTLTVLTVLTMITNDSTCCNGQLLACIRIEW